MYHSRLISRGYSNSSSISFSSCSFAGPFSSSTGLFLANYARTLLCYLFLWSMILPQERLTLRLIQFSISILGTPCMPKILSATLSLPALAAGTRSMFSLCCDLACWIIESMDENFLGHLGQLKCLAFWWWCRITSFLKDF